MALEIGVLRQGHFLNFCFWIVSFRNLADEVKLCVTFFSLLTGWKPAKLIVLNRLCIQNRLIDLKMRWLSGVLLRTPSVSLRAIIQDLLGCRVINWCFSAVTFCLIIKKVLQFCHLNYYFLFQHLVCHFQAFETLDLLRSFIYFRFLGLHFLPKDIVLHLLL